MANYHLRIITPDKPVYDGDAERLIVRTTDGDVCIMANHINYLTAVGIGEAKVVTGDGQTRTAAVNGGMLSVIKNEVSLLATTFEWSDEIDVVRAEKAKAEAEARLSKLHKQDVEFRLAEAKLKRALTRIGAGKNGKR